MPRFLVLLACLFAALAPGHPWSQPMPTGIKPPESATKVRKVMVYSRIGGWHHTEGVTALEDAIAVLARKKGFEYRIVTEHQLVTPDFLEGFDVLVWNNNFDASSSLPDSSAKQALLEYIHAGGGWVGVHGALDYSSSWPALAELIGVSSSRWRGSQEADLSIDREALSDPELVHMVAGFPPIVRVQAEPKGYDRTVRGSEGIVVGATMQNLSPPSVNLIPNSDGIAEQAIWWARKHGKGRMFMTDLGHFSRHYAVSDSFPVKALWEHLRYAAGDYQNGCTDTTSPFFDPAARVDDASCVDGIPTLVSGRPDASGNGATIRLDGLQPSRFPLPFAPGNALSAELIDFQGRRVWVRRLSYSGRLHRVTGLEPGVYLLRLRDGKRQASRKVLVTPRD